MKTKTSMLVMLLFALFMTLASCGPVIISSRPESPPPPWFYPHRVEMVRYVYFPDYMIYYDLSLRNYIYLENGAWITVTVLPQRFNTINFHRARFVRIQNYRGDHIGTYHRDSNRGRSNQDSRTNSGRKSTKSRNTPKVME